MNVTKPALAICLIEAVLSLGACSQPTSPSDSNTDSGESAVVSESTIRSYLQENYSDTTWYSSIGSIQVSGSTLKVSLTPGADQTSAAAICLAVLFADDNISAAQVLTTEGISLGICP